MGWKYSQSPHPDGARTILFVDGEVVRNRFTPQPAREIDQRSQ